MRLTFPQPPFHITGCYRTQDPLPSPAASARTRPCSWWCLNMWCLRYSRDTHGPERSAANCSPEISNIFLLYRRREPAMSPLGKVHLGQMGNPRQRGLCSGLYHCGRILCTLTTVINSSVLSLHPADFKCEICPWPTATESVWDIRVTLRNLIDQSLWRLAWFMLKPIQIGVSITMYEALTRLAGDGGSLSRDDRQGEWSLGHHNVPTGS